MATTFFPPTLRDTFPIDFQLLDNNGRPTIAISDDPNYLGRFQLTLTNTGTQSIVFDETAPAHFNLSFRKGTFSAQTLKVLQLNGSWFYLNPKNRLPYVIQTTETGDSHVIAFRCVQKEKLDPGFRTFFILEHLTAAAVGGDRLTQVMFSPRYIVPPQLQNGLAGIRRQPLQVLRSSSGAWSSAFSLESPDSIVNDGSTNNTLHLKVSNPNDETVQFTPRNQEAPTTLTVTFNVSDITEDSALTDSARAREIIAEVEGGSGWHVSDQISHQGRLTGFSFTTDSTGLTAGDSFVIVLKNIISKTAADEATITLRYENLPDPLYLGGSISVPVPKVSKP